MSTETGCDLGIYRWISRLISRKLGFIVSKSLRRFIRQGTKNGKMKLDIKKKKNWKFPYYLRNPLSLYLKKNIKIFE